MRLITLRKLGGSPSGIGAEKYYRVEHRLYYSKNNMGSISKISFTEGGMV